MLLGLKISAKIVVASSARRYQQGRVMHQKDEQYSERESQRRFKALVQVALKSPPKPVKSMGPKGVPAQSKKRQRVSKIA
jgi:hypothetical protein